MTKGKWLLAGGVVVAAVVGFWVLRANTRCGGKFLAVRCPKESVKPLFYRHPMRPDVHSALPAKDEMGMDYVAVYETAGEDREGMVGGRAPVALSRDEIERIGVRTDVVRKMFVVRPIRTYGVVAYDPNLFNAVAEYREAVSARSRVRESPVAEVRTQADRMVEAARMKLRLLGVTPSQVGDERSLLVNEKGARIWVYADVFESDLPYVSPGQRARVVVSALKGKSFRGEVVSVDPVLQPATRSARARIQIVEGDVDLRPEMTAEVTIDVQEGEKIIVPRDAVFDTGEAEFVYVETEPHVFAPRPVTVGLVTDDGVEISRGLKEGEKIAIEALFLLDSEARFRGASGGTASPHAGHVHD